MISLLEASTNTQLDIRCLPVHSLLDENYFDTVPMIAFHPTRAPQREDEEEVYTSFEEAISERAARISRHLSSLPLAAQSEPHVAPELASGATCNVIGWQAPAWRPHPMLAIFSTGLACLRRCLRAGRRAITLTCLALSLLLAGFDLMGLLILLR